MHPFLNLPEQLY